VESIICTNFKCFLCGKNQNLECHHFIHGTANRKLADEHGLYAYLCRDCHNKVHTDAELDLQLKIIAQLAFERKVGREQFMKVFGRSWIDERVANG
jgi:uncharacterized protein YlaI